MPTPEELAALEAQKAADDAEVARRAAAPEGTQDKRGNVIIPQGAMKRIKQEQLERGRKQAMNELDEIAKAAGFANAKEAFAAIGKAKPSTTETPAARVDAPANRNGDGRQLSRRERKEQARLARVDNKSTREMEQTKQQLEKTKRENNRMQRMLDEREAEASLFKIAVAAGIRDERKAKIAIELVRDHVRGLTPEQIKEFDEAKFFAELKPTEPWLFQETVRPASTTPTNGAGGAGTPAAANKVQGEVSATTDADANKMTPAEFQNHLAKRGWNVPTA